MPNSIDRSLMARSILLLIALTLITSPLVTYGQNDKPAAKKSAVPATGKNTPRTNTKPTEKKTVKPAVPADEDTSVADADAEEQKERLAAERFLTVLEKNPRRGTALDKVYGFHVERGSLDQWIQQYRDRIAKQEQDGIAWMLLGLIEAHRGQDAAAVQALQKAEQFLPENPLASFYLGQSLVLVGQPDLAAAAFEKAIERKPAQADLLEIFQALGRVYQRGQKSDQALEVWNRLEKLFPNDLRVQEQIAQTLVEEGQAALALPRFEALAAKATKDLYRQSQYRIQVAEIKVRLGKTHDGLADFEALLGQLNPDNWLFRDVRHKIDEVFLQSDDQAGLATYYEGWIAKHADDVDAMARLARLLATQGRVQESQKWLEKGLQLAPSRKELRMAIIDQFVFDQKYSEAIQQYEILDQREPNNPDTLREWGRLILKDQTRQEADRRLAAAALWKRLVAAKPKDPLMATQVADLFRHAEMADDALALYQKAIELAPDAPQYREYLGEYYHQLKRPEEALATWRQIASDKNRTAPNLARLAEVLMGFSYLTEGIAALTDAVTLDSQDFDLRMRLAKAFNRDEKYDLSLEQLATATTLAANAEESEAVLRLQLQNYQAAEKLPAQIQELEKELAATPAAPAMARKWYLLARYLEADRKLTDALRAIHQAVELEPQSIPSLAAKARIQEASNSLLDAAETNRKLAAVDRRFRTEYLTNVAKLEARLGRGNQALQAGRDVISSAPGNPESYEFFAQLCFQLGENNEGLETLRRSVRVNPSDPKVVLGLASALAGQFKTAEAIELYWRAFEKDPEIEAKLDIISKLTELYLLTNHLDRLLDRLERERRENAQQQRIMTLCLAQAHQAAGDFGTARSELERMLTPDTRDTPLLQQLAKLAESEGDYLSAIKYQEQLNKVAPSREHDLQLANYLLQTGDVEQAGQLTVKVALEEKDPDKLLKSLDNLLQRQQSDQALLLTERLLRDQPRNWEYLYRDGVALFARQPVKAEERFRQILALNLPDDEPSASTKALAKHAATKAAGQRLNQSGSPANADNSLLNKQSSRSKAAQVLRYLTGLDPRNRAYSASSFWAPTDYGMARMAAYAWMMSAAQKKGQLNTFVNTQKGNWERAKSAPRNAWDWYYIQMLQQNPAELHEAALALVTAPGATAEAQYLYLMSLNSRSVQNTAQMRRAANKEPPPDTTPALPEEELKLVLDLYNRTLTDPLFEEVSQSHYCVILVNIVTTELKRAKREPEASKLCTEAVDRAQSPDQINAFMNKAATDGNMDQFIKLWDRLDKIAANGAGKTAQQNPVSINPQTLTRLMAERSDAKALPDVIKLLDRYMVWSLANKRTETAAHRSQNKAFGNPNGAGGRASYSILLGKNNNDYINIDFPTPNAHFDYSSILLLRNAFALFKQVDQSSDLLQYFETAANKPDTPLADRLPWLLGKAYLHWWNESQDLALKELLEIAEAIPDDHHFKLELAEHCAERKELTEALELLNSITPLDQDVMQHRETLALQIAIRVGETERAREAAARLFGLRLDAETQVQLASQMAQLGMHEQSEAVMARAGRQAGNRLSALSSLMRQFQAQGKTDTALQIAQTILRRTQSRAGSMPNRYSSQDENGELRQQAIQFLVDSGKLQDLIERSEIQLKSSPKSIQLHQTLSEFYTAAGDKEKAKQVTLKLAELSLNDPLARWNVAKQLLTAGDTDAALEHLKIALKQRPQLFANDYWEIQNAFRHANKVGDLVKILDELDLKQMGQYYVISNIIQELAQEEATRPASLKLLKRAWETFPEERSDLLTAFYDESLSKTPELYDYARQVYVPQGDIGVTDPWAGFDIHNYGNNGKVHGSLHQLLVAAKTQNKLTELEQEAQQALAKYPEWHGGHAMLAIIQLQRGDHEPALKTFRELLADQKKGLTGTAAWLIGQELNELPNSDGLALQFYEFAQADPSTDHNHEFQFRPAAALVSIYDKMGQKEKARELLLKAYATPSNNRYDPQYQAYQRLQTYYGVAEQLRKLGFAIDAIKIYNRILLDQTSIELANNFGSREFSIQARKGLESALAKIDSAQLAACVRALIQPVEGASKDPQAPVVDLFLSLNAGEGKPERVSSLLASILDKIAKQPAMQAELTDSMQKLAGERPEDISVRILATLASARGPAPEAFMKSVEELDQWVTAHPLEELTPDKKPNLRQREAAARQISLWLVARECRTREPLRPAGQRLATRALEAAGRQGENSYLIAMIRESGQVALEAGDLTTAEARWTELLDLILLRQGRPPSPGALLVTPSTPATSRKSFALPATLTQFNQILGMAKQAEDRKLHSLSLKAMQAVFRGGPPVEIDPNLATSGQSRGLRFSPFESQTVDSTVANGVWDIHKLWTRHHVPADQIYDVLAGIVFPTARPGDVLLYPQVLPVGDTPEPRSVGLLLVKQAIAANRTDALREQLDKLSKVQKSEFHAQLLLAMLAMETKDASRAKVAFQDIDKMIDRNPSQNAAELVCHVTVGAIDHAELGMVVQPLLLRALKQLTTGANNRNNAERVGSLIFRMAQIEFKAGRQDSGRQLLNEQIKTRDAMYANYDGDYGNYMHKRTLQIVAGEFAKAGELPDALQKLGEAADMPKPEQNYGDVDDGSMAVILKLLAARTPEDQYTILRDWTLPTEGRKTIRMLAHFGPDDSLPESFVKGILPLFNSGKPYRQGLESSAKLLVSAAEKANKLDELEAAVKPLAEQKLERSRELLILIQTAKKRSG